MKKDKEEKIIESTQEEQAKEVLSVEEEQAVKYAVQEIKQPDSESTTETVAENIDSNTAKPKNNIWKTIWHIIKGKFDPNEEDSRFSLASITSFITNMMALLLFGGSLIFAFAVGIYLKDASWQPEQIFNNITIIVMGFVFLLVGSSLALMLRVLALGIYKEKDKHYVLAMFSGMTGFVALIISLIALFK